MKGSSDGDVVSPYAERQFKFGKECFRGGSDADYVRAFGFFKEASDLGHAAATFMLAGMYSSGRGVKKDISIAIDLYIKAAERGDADALFHLGWRFANGIDVVKDTARAIDYYQSAADIEHAPAQYNLGVIYLNDKEFKDERKALRLFVAAAENRYSDAEFNLGWMYDNGIGTERNVSLALHWYGKAAENGDVQAKRRMRAIRDEDPE